MLSARRLALLAVVGGLAAVFSAPADARPMPASYPELVTTPHFAVHFMGDVDDPIDPDAIDVSSRRRPRCARRAGIRDARQRLGLSRAAERRRRPGRHLDLRLRRRQDPRRCDAGCTWQHRDRLDRDQRLGGDRAGRDRSRGAACDPVRTVDPGRLVAARGHGGVGRLHRQRLSALRRLDRGHAELPRHVPRL